MISIIICSRTQNIKESLSENIKSTIGCNYELIVINNSKNLYSIFEAYNLGIKKSVGTYLCFIHDDLFFHTNGWGKVVSRIFDEYPDYGMVGVAGSKVKTKLPSGWWDCEEKYKSVNIIQQFTNGNIEKQYLGFEYSKLNEVVVIDGVFMALRKNEDLYFNEELKGFHNYDLNISFEIIKKGYKIGVSNEILLEHFSMGNLNEDWLKSTIEIHNRYSDLLPITIMNTSAVEIEIFGGKRFINHCLRIVGKKKIYKYCFLLLKLNLFWKIKLPLLKYLTKRMIE